MKKITLDQIEQFNQLYDKKPVQKALKHVLVKTSLSDVANVNERKVETQFRFSHEIKTLPVSNQKQSGRCWIFAGLNVLREEIAKKYDLAQFEFSQNYVAFWDKFEKINYFIESIDDFLDCDADDRTLKHILNTGIQDGGQWDMFVSLVEKYGVVPKDVMEETKQSSATMFMNRVINLKLRKYASEARKIHTKGQDALKTLKAKVLEELYTFLVTSFGMPPKTFSFEYVNKAGDYNMIKDLTPLAFYHEHVGECLSDYISIINSPTVDKPYMRTYTVSYLGNVVGGKEIKYLNLDIKTLKELVLRQIMNKEIVWFGSDVSRFGDREVGVWDDQSYAFEEVLELDLKMDKASQLDYGQSQMNHAMVLTGVNIVDGLPNRYKIENSWGDQNGQKGYYLATDSWFDQFVFQACIHKKYLNKEQLAAWNEPPIVLKPWDPMGSLAK